MSNVEAAIEVRGLRKVYGEKVAVDGIDLTVTRGDVDEPHGANVAGTATHD